MLDFITYDEKTQMLTFLPNEAVKEVLVKDKAFTITYKDGKQNILKFEAIDTIFDPYNIQDIFVKDNATYHLEIEDNLFQNNQSSSKYGKYSKNYYIGQNTHVNILDSFYSDDEFRDYMREAKSKLKHLATDTTVTFICADQREERSIYQGGYFISNSVPGLCRIIGDTAFLDKMEQRVSSSLRSDFCGNFDLYQAGYLSNYIDFINKVKKESGGNLSRSHMMKARCEYEFMNIPLVTLNIINFDSDINYNRLGGPAIIVKITKQAPENLSFTNLHEHQQHPFYPFIAAILNSYKNTQSRSNLHENLYQSKGWLSNSKDGDHIFKSAVLLQMGLKDRGTNTNNSVTLEYLDLGQYFITKEFLADTRMETSNANIFLSTPPYFTLEVTLPLLTDGTCPIAVEAPDTLPKETFMVSENKLIINPKTTFFVIEKTFTAHSELVDFVYTHPTYTFSRKGNTLHGESHDMDTVLRNIVLTLNQPLTDAISKFSITTTLTIPGQLTQTKHHLLGQVFKQ